jgi:heat shock protein HslJ
MKYLFVVSTLLLAFVCPAQTQKIIYIADHTVSCDSSECMQIKENKKGEWKSIKDTVIGLAYEEGYEYKVKVVVSKSNNYSLLKLISKKKTKYNPAVKLEGKKWVLVSMFDSVSTMRLRDTMIFINIDVVNGKLTGHGICNQMKGKVEAEGKKIAFIGVAYTKMKCVEQGNIFEAIVKALLDEMNYYQLERGTLTFYSNRGSNIVFKQQ